MGKIRELKDIIVESKMDLVRATVPHGHCPYVYYHPSTTHDDCGEIECTECRRRFLGDMEADIRKEVRKL